MSLIPHSPFGGGMRATQNSKLGTGKSRSELDRARKIFISFNERISIDFMFIVLVKKRITLKVII